MKKVLMVMAILASSPAFAGGGLSTEKVYAVAFQTGGFFLYAKDWQNPNSCTMSNAIVLASSDANYEKAYSLLLTAYASGKKVTGYSDGCAEFDGQTYNTIRGFKYLKISD